MRALVGDEGSLLNPFQDIDGNWLLSVEEWDAKEFQKYKVQFSELIGKFELIEYKPKPMAFPPKIN